MNAGETIKLEGPQTLTLTPQTLATILDALADRPFRVAQPAFLEIMGQLGPRNQPSPAPLGDSNVDPVPN